MKVYCLYAFSSGGECFLYMEWERERQPSNAAHDRRVVHGLILSAESAVTKLGSQDGVKAIRADAYTIHCFASPTGVRLALLTEATATALNEQLWHIYANLYVPLVVRNPAPSPSASALELFQRAVAEHVHSFATASRLLGGTQ